MREALAALAKNGHGDMPLCVVSHGFGTVLATDYFSQLEASPPSRLAASPLERGETLAFFCTLGSPLPLLLGGSADAAPDTQRLKVPTRQMLDRWPWLRGGWTNFHHRSDLIGFPLKPSHPAVTNEVVVGQPRPKGDDRPVQAAYLTDLADFVRPVAQSLSWVWQDTNRPTAQQERASGK